MGGLADHDVLILDEAGRRVSAHQVTHTVEGLIEWKEVLTSISSPENKTEMACIVETNHGLLIAVLLETGFSVDQDNLIQMQTRLVNQLTA